MHRFEYRLPRIATGFSIDFIVDHETLHGVCKDVSEAGIRAEFDGTVGVGSIGLLILRHPIRLLKLQAQVAYIEDDQFGLSFLFDSPQERTVATRFIALIGTHPRGSAMIRSI